MATLHYREWLKRILRLRVSQVVPLLLVALVFVSAGLHAQDRSLLPRYGSLPKAEWQNEADAKFIAAIDKEYRGDRNKASIEIADRGWQYLRQADHDDAMRRFNQAWLLNSKNGVALWGMGAIEADLEKFDEALKLFSEAEPLVGEDISFSVDHARVIAMAGVAQKQVPLLMDALERFEHIYKKAPQNTENLQNWAILYCSLGEYAEAWEKVKLAEGTPGKSALDPKFMEALQAQMPRPKD
jgi:tetratricopeptide (TPR) repeat protein